VAAADHELVQVLDEKGQVLAETPELAPDRLLQIHEAMLTVRRVDQRCMKLQRQGRIGFYGTSTGEEACAVGSAAALNHDDWVFPALRQGGVLLYRGWPIRRWFDHLFGNAASVERGRSMPCHYSDRELGQVAWSSCMATQLPHAVGMAYAAKLKGHSRIAAAYLGDGATSEGDFHVAMNFAAVWKAPVVFICHNNQWAISVPFAKQSGSATVHAKAAAYGMPGVRVDGNDVLAVYQATADAAQRARSGGGPTLIEGLTYRMEGHSSSDDPTRYRDEAEVRKWEARDPIRRFEAFLIGSGATDRAELDATDDRIGQAIDEAVRAAEAEPASDRRTLIEEVYAVVPWHLEEQFAALGGRGAD